ncbi:MAG: hypothetical protein JSV91_01185 [Phycisphaerales bacterium]|nr:MAG: hypothetical protein JSV91_01185 [Phycisphaerales bacterium]
MGSIIGSLALAMFLGIVSLAFTMSGEPEAGAGVACVAYMPIIYGVVMLAILIYKMWAAIQPGPARTTPGKAVGFLFIPFFNFYWIFQAYWGWTKDYNQYSAQRGGDLPTMPEGVAVAICILCILGVVPLVGILAGLINLVLFIIFISAACDGINAIAATTGAAGLPQTHAPLV